MSNSEGTVRPYSDQAFSRGVVVGGAEPPSAASTPSTVVVEPVTQGNLSGADFDTFRGGGVMQTLRDRTGDLVRNRDPRPDDLVTIVTGSGREMTVPLRLAEQEGFVHRDATTGRYAESDRASQAQTVAELQRLEQSKRESEQVRYTDEVEQAVHEMAGAMSEAGLDFGQEFATYISKDDGGSVSEPASQWAQAQGLEMREQMANYASQMRRAVETEVLKPQGIDPEVFLEFLQANRSAAVRAAMFGHYAKNLDGFRQLARQYRDTGWLAKQKRR
jgi:hypothetical protein